MTGASFRFKTSRKKKKAEPLLFEIEGNSYCKNYEAGNVTCINCCENNEGPYRAGCFKRGK